MAAASDYWTGSSQPGWSIEERYVPRGLSSRATRIRRPTRGATRRKKPVSAATATTGALGTSPLDVPWPAACEVRGSPKSDSDPRARRGGAGRALCCPAAGVELARPVGTAGGCHLVVVGRVSAAELGASCARAAGPRGSPRAGPVGVPRSGVSRAAGGPIVVDAPPETTAIETSTSPGWVGIGTESSGSAGRATSGSRTTAIVTSTSGTTGPARDVS
jgi:hypothetical protein